MPTVCHTYSYGERKDQCAHHFKDGRDGNLKEWFYRHLAVHLHAAHRLHDTRERCLSHAECQQSCNNRIDIGDDDGYHQQFACSLTDIGDGWCHQSDDNQRNDERKELPEHAVERGKQPHAAHRQKLPRDNTQYYRDYHSEQKG